MTGGPAVLIADDEETDAYILRLAFKKAGCTRRLFFVHDGMEVVEYLEGRDRFSDRSAFPVPGLILLDLKMPHMNGFDTLTWLAEREPFKAIPALVLSSSDHPADAERSLALGARDYLIKPNTLADFVVLIEGLKERWLA